MVGDEPGVVESQDVDVARRGGLVRSGYAVEWAVVGAAHDPDADDLVAFGHHLVQIEVHVRASTPQAGEHQSRSVGSVGGPRSSVVVDRSWCDEVLDAREI